MYLSLITLFLLLIAGIAGNAATATATNARPNVVLIFCDDLGYADIEPFGSKQSRTPHLNQLARDGRRFTDFSVAQAVCSASRAALLTGCLPNRIGITGALIPNSPTGLHPNEVTLAELLKSRGYSTAIVGKWHLGDAPAFHPLRHGFDEWFGLPYSNDMWPKNPENKTFPPLALYDGWNAIQPNLSAKDQNQLTRRYTQRAVQFIDKNRDHPFFLYVAHSMPHVPLASKSSGLFARSGNQYRDVISEIDASVGDILKALRRNQLDKNTLVIFTSDNGPWLTYGNHAGSAGTLREGKGTTFEGGVRVPFVVRWPGVVPANSTCTEFASTLDLVPTVSTLCGVAPTSGRRLDGQDISSLMRGEVDGFRRSNSFPYYWGHELHAVRSGKWKWHQPHPYAHVVEIGRDGVRGKMETRTLPASLYDLSNDPGESIDVQANHPEVVRELKLQAENWARNVGDSLTQQVGADLRPVGFTTNYLCTPDATGIVTLPADRAIVHGTNLRYEPEPHKNTVGYWNRAEDWVEWDFQVSQSGRYELEALQGCGKGSGGAQVEFSVGNQILPYVVEDTGHFQNFVPRRIGVVELTGSGRQTIQLRAKTKPGGAIGDFRALTLRPVH